MEDSDKVAPQAEDPRPTVPITKLPGTCSPLRTPEFAGLAEAFSLENFWDYTI